MSTMWMRKSTGDKGGVASHKEKGSDKDREIRRAAQRGKLKTKPAF